jgi:hypothetical protein
VTLRTRKPTGMVPPPVILLEGETGSGRSWTTAELSSSENVGRTLWVELGDESTADQYGAIPGVRYEIVRPDNAGEVWDWDSLYTAARDARDEAAKAAANGEPPMVLVVDQVGAIWDMLSEWADNRARNTKANKKELAENPNFEYVIGSNFWNDATDRWRKFITVMLTFKGIVVLLSRGEEITLFENGQPTKKKTWKVAGQKSLTSSMPIWVRLTRDGNPKLVKLRAVVNGIKPGVDREQALPGFTLERLIFERYGWDPQASGSRELVPMVAGDEPPESPRFLAFLTAIETAPDEESVKRQWPHVPSAVEKGEITQAEGEKLRAAVKVKLADLAAAEKPAEAQE